MSWTRELRIARVRKYLALLEAFPLPQTREFVRHLIENCDLQFVALVQGEGVGWRVIRRHYFASQAHRGISAAHRGRGLGFRLITTALKESGAAALFVSNSTCASTTLAPSLFTRRSAS
jgi:hypothetical protein